MAGVFPAAVPRVTRHFYFCFFAVVIVVYFFVVAIVCSELPQQPEPGAVEHTR